MDQQDIDDQGALGADPERQWKTEDTDRGQVAGELYDQEGHAEPDGEQASG